MNHLHGFADYQIFQPLFADGLFLAGLGALGISTFIIMVDVLISTRSALAEHHRATHSTEQLGRQQIIVLRFVPSRSAAVFGDFILHTIEQFFLNDNRDAVRHHNVLKTVLADITAVCQQGLNTVIGKLLVAVGGHAAVVQPVHQFFHGRAIVVPLKGFYHKGGFQRIDLEELFLVYRIANGNRAAVVLALQNILGHAAHDFFRKLCGIVFSHAGEHTLDHNTCWAFRNWFSSRHQLDMVSLQLVLIVCRIITVSGKAVKFPDQHNVKQPFLAVFNHLLELRTIVRFGRECTVNIVLDDCDAVLLCIGRALTNLAFDGFFTLVVAGIAGVNYGGHGRHLTLHIIERQCVHSKHCFV